MRKVIIESPCAANERYSLEDHRRYALWCCYDSAVVRCEAPYASHVLCTQFLDDRDKRHRTIGMEIGADWSRGVWRAFYIDLCSAYYEPLGPEWVKGPLGSGYVQLSDGMLAGLEQFKRDALGEPDFRTLPIALFDAFSRGEYPSSTYSEREL